MTMLVAAALTACSGAAARHAGSAHGSRTGEGKQAEESSLNGRPVRLLSSTAPVETLSDRQRKYLKQVDGSWEPWMGGDGTPLATRRQIKASGRAYVVVAFEFQADE